MWTKFKANLTAKIFLFTTLILILACSLTFSFIVWQMPGTYYNILNAEVEEKAAFLPILLEEKTFKEACDVIHDFASETNTYIALKDPKTSQIYYYADFADSASLSVSVTMEAKTDIENGKTLEEDPYTVSTITLQENTGIYLDTPPIEGKEYIIVIQAGVYAVNQAMEALSRVLPMLILAVLIISIIGAAGYYFYVTRPIVRLSRISKQLAGLNFDWEYKDNRSDEIGVLAQNLNDLATNLDNALQELQEANLALQDDIAKERESERRRLAFFSAVSHELKTPITVIRGQLEGMAESIPPYDNHDYYLNYCLTVTDRLGEIVQEILTISQLETKGFDLNLQKVFLEELLEDIFAEYEPIFLHNELSVTIDSIPTIISADSQHLRHVISNIIFNAAAYTPQGGSITANISEKDGCLILTLDNSPAYIPKHEIKRLFDAFYRVEASRNSATGGSGLGLYIVRMILEQHGFHYSLENHGKGVRFSLTIPKEMVISVK